MRSARPPARSAPWYEAPEFLALSEVRRTFMKGGSAPAVAIRTPEGGARQAVLWTLYELAHVLEELAHRTRSGMPGWCVVRASDHGRGRVVIDLAIEPTPESMPVAGDSGGGGVTAPEVIPADLEEEVLGRVDALAQLHGIGRDAMLSALVRSGLSVCEGALEIEGGSQGSGMSHQDS